MEADDARSLPEPPAEPFRRLREVTRVVETPAGDDDEAESADDATDDAKLGPPAATSLGSLISNLMRSLRDSTAWCLARLS